MPIKVLNFKTVVNKLYVLVGKEFNCNWKRNFIFVKTEFKHAAGSKSSGFYHFANQKADEGRVR